MNPEAVRTPAGRTPSGLFTGTMLNLVAGAATAVSAFWVTVAVSRTLGARPSAGFFEAIAMFSILAVVGTVGSTSGATWSVAQAIAEGRVQDVRPIVRTATVGVAIVSTALALLLFLSAPTVASLLGGGHTPHLTSCFRAVALFLPPACLSTTLLAVTRGFNTMLPSAMVDGVLKGVARIATVTLVVAIVARPAAATIAWGVPVLVAFIASAGCLLSSLRHLGHPRRSHDTQVRPTIARTYWRFSSLQVFSDVFQVGVQWLDILLLGALGTARDTGVYGAIGRLVFVGLMGLVAVAQVLAPRMAALLATGNRREAQSTYQSATVWLCAVSFPLFLTMALFPLPFTALFGTQFSAGAVPLTVLSLGMVANIATGPVMAVLVMGGRSDLGMVDAAAGLIANVGLNVLLIPRFGMTGAAFAWAASIVVVNALPTLQVGRLWGLSPFGSRYWRVACAAALSYGAVGAAARWLMGDAGGALVVASASGSVLYIGLMSRVGLVEEARSTWSSVRGLWP